MSNKGFSGRNNPVPPKPWKTELLGYLSNRWIVVGTMAVVTLCVYIYVRATEPPPPVIVAPAPAVEEPVKKVEDPNNYEGSGRSREELIAGVARVESCKSDIQSYCDPLETDFDKTFRCLEKVEANLSDNCREAMRSYWDERVIVEGRQGTLAPN